LQGDVAGDFGRTNDHAVAVADGRYRQRDVDPAAVLADAVALEVVDALAAADRGEDRAHVVGAVDRHEALDRGADHLVARVAEDALGRLVPGGDHALQGLRDDGVVGRLHHFHQEGPRGFHVAPIGDVADTSTTPFTAPFASRIGAALSSMARSVPSRRISMVWLASPTTRPSASARWAGFGVASRVLSWTIWKTRSSGCPSASSAAHPVSWAATALSEVMRPRRSVVITPSPMLCRVTRNCSRCDLGIGLLRVGGVARAAHGAAERGDAETDGEVQREAAPALDVVDHEPMARLDQEPGGRDGADEARAHGRTEAAVPGAHQHGQEQGGEGEPRAEYRVEQQAEGDRGGDAGDRHSVRDEG
jgi:hypothetical protein